MFSARYAGADPLRQRCVRTQRRNVIRSGTRSQWSSRRSGVKRGVGIWLHGESLCEVQARSEKLGDAMRRFTN